MMKTKGLLALFLGSSLLFGRATTAAEPESLVFTHITVIDATGAPAQPDMTVVITGNRIAELGKSSKIRVPDGTQVVDATGKFIIPGLWDMHAHLAFGFGTPPETWREPGFWLCIANGVTGVRDMGGDWNLLKSWREKIDSGTLVGPRIVAAGPILDGPTPGYPGRITVRNAAEARSAVQSLKQRGVDFIKVHAHLSRESYFAIADEAKKQGLPFAGHVTNRVSLAEASDAGQRSIEHLNEGELLPECSSKEADLRKNYDPQKWLDTYDAARCQALFERFRRNGTWQDPTLVTLRKLAYMDEDRGREDPLARYIPKRMQAMGEQFWELFFKNRTSEEWAVARRVYARQMEIVGGMNRAGVPMLAGTDVAVPGFGIHDELELLVKAGLTPTQALQAATRSPAQFLGHLDSGGTVTRGEVADLVLLDADPLADIRNTQKIAGVVLNGRYLDRTELNKLLAQVEAAAAGSATAQGKKL